MLNLGLFATKSCIVNEENISLNSARLNTDIKEILEKKLFHIMVKIQYNLETIDEK